MGPPGARVLSFLTGETVSLIVWLRIPGDGLFIVGGVLPFVWLSWRGVRYRVPPATGAEPVHGDLHQGRRHRVHSRGSAAAPRAGPVLDVWVADPAPDAEAP